MTVMLVLLGFGTLVELLVHAVLQKRARIILASIALVSISFACGGIVTLKPHMLGLVFLSVSVYRCFNMIRAIRGRLLPEYLRRVALKTSLYLIPLHAVILAGWWAWEHYHVHGYGGWTAVAALQLVTALIIFLSTTRSLNRTAWPDNNRFFTDHELPTLSVVIPARNETEDLQLCLQSVVRSDYPKLEILVYDDCSQFRRTPEIIRSFAHDGVRFIEGDADIDEKWLPKNHAYKRLAAEASGEYLLFCGVDVRFEPDTIRKVVGHMLLRNKTMVSLLPLRAEQTEGRFSLIQAMRYWWELAPPRRMLNRPPVLSSCWAITRRALKKAGGFEAVHRAILPEAFFAKTALPGDGYSFMRSTPTLGLVSAKLVADQRETATRMRYPQMHRRPEKVLLLTLAELGLLVTPFAFSVLGFFVSIGATAHIMAILSSALLTAAYVRVARATRINRFWFSFMAFPAVILTDIAVLHYSMWKYEFSVVDWKGRNICVPVMHVIPHLPKF